MYFRELLRSAVARCYDVQRTSLRGLSRLVRSRVYYIDAAGGDCCIVNCVVIYGFHAWTRLRHSCRAAPDRMADGGGGGRGCLYGWLPGAGLDDRSTCWVVYQHAAMTTHALPNDGRHELSGRHNKNSSLVTSSRHFLPHRQSRQHVTSTTE